MMLRYSRIAARATARKVGYRTGHLRRIRGMPMYPIRTPTLSFLEISDHWSRDIKPPASRKELFHLLESAWWLGEFRGDAIHSRLTLLRKMFKSMRNRDDLGIVFIIGDGSGPEQIDLPDGSVMVDVRHQVRVPHGNPETWTEESCSEAFRALADTSSAESYPELGTHFGFIQLTYKVFRNWLAERGYDEPTFWQPQLNKVKKAKRGAKPQWDWEDIELFVGQTLDTKGDFGDLEVATKGWQSFSDLYRAIEDYVETRRAGGGPGTAPSRSVLKVRIPRIVDRWRDKQK
jgi:hypothetical protein